MIDSLRPELLALALQASKIGFYEWDIPKNEVLFSTQMRKDWGVPEEHIGRLTDATSFIHVDDRSRVEAEIARCIAGHLDYAVEYRVVRPVDGKIVWLDVRGKIEYIGEAPARFLGTCINITARKEIEASEKRANANLQLALHAGRMATWYVDLKTFEATISPEVAKIFGVESVEGEDVGSIINRVIHPDDRENANRVLSEAVQSGTPYRNEYRVIWPSGEVRWVLAQGDRSAVQPDGGATYAGVILDITERKRAEEVLQKSRNELKEFLEAMPQMAFVAEPNGDIIYYNDRHYEYFGIDSGEHDRWGWRDSRTPAVHPDDVQKTTEIWGAALRTGEIYQIEYRLRRKDGEFRWHLGRAVPARDEKRNIVRWYGTNTDIHPQKSLEAALTDSVRARDDFLSIASHELKTPLTSLKLQSELHTRAVRKGDPSAYAKERIDDLVSLTDKQVRRLNRLVEDMLDVARIRSGNLSISRERFDLSDAAREVIERLESQFQYAKSPTPTISRADEGVGEWDRLRIEQVLANLLTNAIRYGKRGPIDVSVENHGAFVRLKVADEGIGIAERDQDKIFDRFERAIDANEVSGLGLGLFITKKIVLAHGGKIRVESKLNQGSTFIVDLPVSPDPHIIEGEHHGM